MNNLISSTFKNYPIIILVSAFTPYISPTSGIKGDNIIIYLFASLALVILITRQKFMFNKNLTIIFVIWVSVFIFLFTRTIFGGGFISSYALIAEIKNFSQPVAIMFIFLVMFFREKFEYIDLLLKRASIVLIFLLNINTIWIFLGMSFDLLNINQYFVREVALKAAGNNRFSGFFNQPMEAGIAYSVGLFSWMYLVSKKHINVKMKYVIMLALIFVGGIVSVSKIFIFGGIGIFFLNLIFRKNFLKKSKNLFLWIPIIIPISVTYLSNNWQGGSYFNRLFMFENIKEQGFINLITAGRFGGESSQQKKLMGMIWESSPFIGQGMGSQKIYDSAFFHFFSSGGLIALSMYILVIFYLIVISLNFFIYNYIREEAVYFFNIVAIIILASFGSPILTINRASVIIWVFVALLLLYINKRKSLEENFKSNF